MRKPVHYLQTDKRWKAHDYSATGEKTNIGEQGCGPTSAAMVIASLKDSKVTPVTTAEWSKSHKYKAKGCGTYYSYFVPQLAEYGIKCSRVNSGNLLNLSKTAAYDYHRKAFEALKQGKWLIVCVGKGLWTSSGHYMLVYGYDNGNVFINDPASTRSVKLTNTWALLSSQVKYYWIVDVPEEKTEVTYSVFANGKWLPTVTNGEDYAGIEKKAISGIKINCNKCSIKYRVHVIGGKWTAWAKDGEQLKVSGQIDKVEIHTSDKSIVVKYRTSITASTAYLPFVSSKTTIGPNSYAGQNKKAIDKLQIIPVK